MTSPDAIPLRNVATDALEHRLAFEVGVKASELEAELARVLAQIRVIERLLAAIEDLVHLPVPALARCGLGCPGGGERVGMDLGQRKVAKREPQIAAELLLHPLDLAVRPPRVRTLVIAVLEDHMGAVGATNVVYRLVQRLDFRLSSVRHERRPLHPLENT